jgi:hypothetical protein
MRRRSSTRNGGWKVYLDLALEPFMAYVDDAESRMVVSPYTWEVLSEDLDASRQFIDDMIEGGSGMHFVVADAPPYRGAVRKHAERKGTDVSQVKDPLTQLAEQINALVVQAASLNASPTALQQQVFATRYATAQADFAKLEDQIDGLRAMLDLAATAIYDTTT